MAPQSPAVPLFVVDAFTSEPFGGNQAAVCLLPAGLDAPDPWRQALAAEMKFSETAFVQPEGDHFRLRWFTPTAEVDLCGHATLASAHILWEQGILPRDEPASFETRSGRLTCRQAGEGIAMDFPDESVAPCEAPAGFWEAFGTAPAKVLRNRLDFMAVLKDEAAVRALRPDFKALAALSDVRGFIATARSADPAYDYVCRYFAPTFGIDEDPATGSIQCALGPYWAKELGKASLRMRQLSARGATMAVAPSGGRVAITGRAVTVTQGRLAPAGLPTTPSLRGRRDLREAPSEIL